MNNIKRKPVIITSINAPSKAVKKNENDTYSYFRIKK